MTQRLPEKQFDSPRVKQDMGVKFGRVGHTDAAIESQNGDPRLDSPWVNQRLRENQFYSPKLNQDLGIKFGSVGRTYAPSVFPLEVFNVFCSSVGGLVRARGRHFGRP